MDYQELVCDLAVENEARIVFLVMDGLGGTPLEPGGPTELEAAKTPNLDKLAAEGSCGLADPIQPGVTPGSGPGHLALFGYDPVKWNMGRGVLEALGIDFELKPGDVAIRINFCTLDDDGRVSDRRAGRISTEKCVKLSSELDKIEVEGAQIKVMPVKEHRAAMVLRGRGLGDRLNDTDPQVTGKPPLTLQPGNEDSRKTARVLNAFLEKAREVLAGHHPANMILLRGIDSFKEYPSFYDLYKLKAAAIAQYPMYKGLARMVGMDILEAGDKLDHLVDALQDAWADYTFFFLHVKKTDSYGEDGDFQAKANVIESVDALVPRITKLGPEVLVVTGDHSTPALLKSHSWHPLPVLLHSKVCRPDEVSEFSEKACARGGLGRIHSTSLMPIAMANAMKLKKFGA